jgi:hypothetical protein
MLLYGPARPILPIKFGAITMSTVLAKLLLGPGELLVHQARIEGDDHQMTVRMLVNGLFWGFVIGALALFFLT